LTGRMRLLERLGTEKGGTRVSGQVGSPWNGGKIKSVGWVRMRGTGENQLDSRLFEEFERGR